MDVQTVTPVALVVAGVVIFGCALIWTQRLRRPVDFSWDKIGLTFKADTSAFVLLLAFGLIVAGAVPWYQDFEIRLKNMKGENQKLQGKVDGMEDVLRKFKEFNVTYHLVFPETDIPQDIFKTEVKAFVRRKGERNDKPYELVDVNIGYGGIAIEIQKLSFGDRVFIVVQHGNKAWRSTRMKMPAGHLKMHSHPQT